MCLVLFENNDRTFECSYHNSREIIFLNNLNVNFHLEHIMELASDEYTCIMLFQQRC